MTWPFVRYLGCALTLTACSGAPAADTVTGSAADSGSAGSNQDAATAGEASSDASSNGMTPSDSCASLPNDDVDQDGSTAAQGDCNDCDARINPGAYDFPANGHDEDCQGGDANAGSELCDDGIAITSFDAQDGARAMGLCAFPKDATGWGVLSARYASVDGSRALGMDEAVRVGVVPTFGSENPRKGKRLLVLSSGVARAPGQAGYDDSCGDYFTSGTDGWPAAYPRPSPACGNSGGGSGSKPSLFDPTSLELKIRVPSNAKGLSFETNFYTYEYPDYICSAYNDYFLVLMDPAPSGHADGNIVFDSEGNWVSVNNGLLQVCEPGTHGGKTFKCPLGQSALEGTGYAASDTLCGEGASTGWLRTQVPVTPGSTITLRFMIWDTNDPNRDSTVLIDKLEWELQAPAAVETKPVLI